MANSNNICTRFINYVAVLILAFLSSSVFAAGGSFGGGGAGGSWGEQCHAGQQSTEWYSTATSFYSTPEAVCDSIYQRYLTTGWASIEKSLLPNSNGTYRCALRLHRYNGSYQDLVNTVQSTIKTQKCDECPSGYERLNGQCQPKKCPIGQSLVNGVCKTKTCPIGQALDSNGNCMPRDDQCPAGQIMVNGRCTQDPNDGDEPPPPAEWPPFCEWASEMCQWHKEWQQWSNDYAANEEKANLDREELKRLSLDSKEQLTEINSKQEAIKQAIQANSLTLEQVKQQDKQFYDELRLWLDNFDPEQGSPSEQYPPVQFPVFCDWSTQVCNWYLDWKDWRTDYNANNIQMKEKFDEHLARLKEIKEQDAQHYQETKTFFNRAKDFFDETLSFFDEIRQFLAQQESGNNTDPSGDVPAEDKNVQVDESQKITFINGCPAGEQFTVSFMGTSNNLEFSYQPLCQFMSMIRPFVIAIAYLIGAYIVMGLSRGSSE